MSILGARIPRARVVDLFAGSGALGLEALSRGADRVEFVEQAPRSIAALTANIALLGAAAQTVIHRADATQFVAGLGPGAFDVAFADPPYRQGFAQQLAERWVVVPFADVLGIEHPRGEPMPPGGDTRPYGTSAVTFYRRPPGA